MLDVTYIGDFSFPHRRHPRRPADLPRGEPQSEGLPDTPVRHPGRSPGAVPGAPAELVQPRVRGGRHLLRGPGGQGSAGAGRDFRLERPRSTEHSLLYLDF